MSPLRFRTHFAQRLAFLKFAHLLRRFIPIPHALDLNSFLI